MVNCLQYLDMIGSIVLEETKIEVQEKICWLIRFV